MIYVIAGIFVLAAISSCTDEKTEDSDKEQVLQEQAEDSLSQAEPDEENSDKAESEKEDSTEAQQPETLTDTEQKKYIDSVISEYEKEYKMPEIIQPELYEEKNVYDCVYKRMQEAVKKKITEDTVYQSLKYQKVYETWYPEGVYQDIFLELEKEYDYLLQENKTIEEYNKKYSGNIKKAYNAVFDLESWEFYVQYKIEQGILSSVVNKLTGDDYIYYYANDVEYTLFGTMWGDAEYLIRIGNPLKQKGEQVLKGYFTNDYETMTTSDGFEREIPVFRAYTEKEIEKISNDYEAYLEEKENVAECKQRIGKILQKKESAKKEKKSSVKNQSDYIFPDSDTQKLKKSQVLKLSRKERWIAKNEIYARHGRKFLNEELQDYFNSTSWYTGSVEAEDFDESVFNRVEKVNVRLLAKYESA